MNTPRFIRDGQAVINLDQLVNAFPTGEGAERTWHLAFSSCRRVLSGKPARDFEAWLAANGCDVSQGTVKMPIPEPRMPQEVLNPTFPSQDTPKAGKGKRGGK